MVRTINWLVRLCSNLALHDYIGAILSRHTGCHYGLYFRQRHLLFEQVMLACIFGRSMERTVAIVRICLQIFHMLLFLELASLTCGDAWDLWQVFWFAIQGFHIYWGEIFGPSHVFGVCLAIVCIFDGELFTRKGLRRLNIILHIFFRWSRHPELLHGYWSIFHRTENVIIHVDWSLCLLVGEDFLLC